MKKLLLLAGLFSTSIAFCQNANRFWKSVDEKNITVSGDREIVPHKYLTFSLNDKELKEALWSAPHEKDIKLKDSKAVIYLPAPDGNLQAFTVVESPCMDADLSAGYNHIRTYDVKGIDDIYAYGKLDWNDFGFHGMIRTPNGSFFIDPYCRNNQTEYITYYKADFEKDPSQRMEEIGVLGEDDDHLDLVKKEANALDINATCVGTNLRTYRLAVACTGEYAVAATGVSSPSISQILSKVVTTVNRVDGIYETDVAIKLVLVSTTTLVLYPSGSTDAFNGNGNGSTLIGESQTVITNSVGTNNFDIGHTFSTGGGGLAQLGCVCKSTSKARGITGSLSPVGDAYDIDYVAHEMGHQFGGNHTFNASTGSCSGNRNASTSMEPGSGITVMGYAGICSSNDLVSHSIAYFHPVSYDEIIAYTSTSSGSTCPVSSNTGNHAPVVSISSTSINVPPSTPFSLTGSATDQDGDAVTYSWEEMDAGAAAGNWNSGNKPFFMSYAPSTSGTRNFPKLANILTGSTTYTTSKGEFLSPNAQTLKFRLTARDGKMGGGGVCSATATVVVAAGGAFSVTTQNTTGISYPGGSTQTVSWTVASTTASPVSCANVSILVSTNNGSTWTTVLASTPNDGSQSITMPTVATTTSTCRVKVQCSNGAFFDINDRSFTLTNVTGISEMSAANSFAMQLYPNPFNGNVQIEAYDLNGSATTRLTIVDLLGNVVLRDDIAPGTMISKHYNLEHLSAGVYIVQLTNGNKRSMARLVKQ